MLCHTMEIGTLMLKVQLLLDGGNFGSSRTTRLLTSRTKELLISKEQEIQKVERLELKNQTTRSTKSGMLFTLMNTINGRLNKSVIQV